MSEDFLSSVELQHVGCCLELFQWSLAGGPELVDEREELVEMLPASRRFICQLKMWD